MGLRRAGFAPAERLELKQLYRLLFREQRNLREAGGGGAQAFLSAPARLLLDFVAAARRGVCSDVGGARESSDI